MGYAQITPTSLMRIATRTTVFGKNLPAGTEIRCIADSTSWDVGSAGVATTATINTAWAAGTITLRKTKVQNSATRGATGIPVAIDTLKATYQSLVLPAATTTYAGAMTAADKTKLDAVTTSADASAAETFETATDSLTVSGSGFYTVTLAVVAKDSSAFIVSVNGVELRHASGGQYTVMVPNLAAKRVQLNIPIYKYDLISVGYSK